MDYFKKLKEKAKAYDKAIERAREYWKTDNDNTLDIKAKGTMEYLFPELAESEEERIRKDCIKYLDWEYQHCPINEDKMKIEKCVAWLEKQGNKVIDCSQNHQDSNRPNGCIVFEDFNGGEGFYKLNLDYLNKKQLEEVEELVRTWNKESTYSVWVGGDEINDHYLTKDEAEKLADKYRKNGYDDVVVEEIKQRSANKIEPKFKVGDWVVYNRNDSSREILYIYDIRDGRYYFNDNVHFSWSVKECDEKCHLWTIQDAKAGDILVCPKYAGDTIQNIFIFKDIEIKDNDVYCYCSFLKIFATGGYVANADPINTDFYPATKEQCDLLFQKMVEAGYMWDTKNKELLKI